MPTHTVLDSLESLEYNLRAVTARVSVLRKRLIDEKILKTPFKTYGNPPKVLSEALTDNKINEILASTATHIQHCAKQARKIDAQSNNFNI